MPEQILIGLHMFQTPENTYAVSGLAVLESSCVVLCKCITLNVLPPKALNAALARLAEKLYLARHIPSPDLTNLAIYAKPHCRPYVTHAPLQIVRSHWTITEARKCLTS